MSPDGGRSWVRGPALLLVFVSSGAALSSCEYADEEPSQAAAPTGYSRPAPAPPVYSRPAPAPPVLLPAGPCSPAAGARDLAEEQADRDLAEEQAGNQAQLDVRLGPRPDGLVWGAFGGLGGDGFEISKAGISEGRYTVTAACQGVKKASLTLSQSNSRGGTQQELALDCGKVTQVDLKLAAAVSARASRMTTEQGSAAVAAFWMVPASELPRRRFLDGPGVLTAVAGFLDGPGVLTAVAAPPHLRGLTAGIHVREQ